jgi:peptidoglycan hydrolase CwlO-like protein
MIKKTIVVLLLCLTLFRPVYAESDDDKLKKIQDQIDEYRQVLGELAEKEKTLQGQIKYMNSQIELTSLKIGQTIARIEILEAQIAELIQKIGILDNSLDEISNLFINRVVATYKAGKVSSLDLLFSSKGFGDFFRRAKYLTAVQLNDRQMLLAMEQMRQNYDAQKQEKEIKQDELESLKAQLADQKADLDNQKKDKEYLLTVTQNDEKVYQDLLAQALAEYRAIQAILAGQGDETEVGEVKQGEQIASIINAASCNSSGPHLHFTIEQGGNAFNPFNYLKPGVAYENCSGYTCGNGGDPFNPSGSWEWPIDQPIKLTQGYGNTWAVNHQSWLPYNFHNGIDIHNPSLVVRAVKDGTLYRGSYTGMGSCSLRYVRVKHADSDMSTYYLHINYTKV